MNILSFCRFDLNTYTQLSAAMHHRTHMSNLCAFPFAHVFRAIRSPPSRHLPRRHLPSSTPPRKPPYPLVHLVLFSPTPPTVLRRPYSVTDPLVLTDKLVQRSHYNLSAKTFLHGQFDSDNNLKATKDVSLTSSEQRGDLESWQ